MIAIVVLCLFGALAFLVGFAIFDGGSFQESKTEGLLRGIYLSILFFAGVVSFGFAAILNALKRRLRIPKYLTADSYFI